jgi:aminopeptidase N
MQTTVSAGRTRFDDALQFAFERHRFWNASCTAALERIG